MREARNSGGKGRRINRLEVLVGEETTGIRVLERVSRKDRGDIRSMEYLILKLCKVGVKLLVMTRSRKLPWP